MRNESIEQERLTGANHPENRPDPEPVQAPEETSGTRLPPGFFRALVASWLAGTVGCLLTLMTIAHPLGAGDTGAALALLPFALVLIAIVNGWITASIFPASGPPK